MIKKSCSVTLMLVSYLCMIWYSMPLLVHEHGNSKTKTSLQHEQEQIEQEHSHDSNGLHFHFSLSLFGNDDNQEELLPFSYKFYMVVDELLVHHYYSYQIVSDNIKILIPWVNLDLLSPPPDYIA